MVMYSVDSDFYSGTLNKLHELRGKGALCDVTLTIGQARLPAHSCVLAVGSQYFHTLFLGQFKEASMSNINLSEVTDDVKALELVVDFLYTGTIDICDSNLRILVKLSTFFLIEPLREFCIQHMKKHLNLQTCLQYYLYAVEHSLADIEKETKSMVMSRFHDFIIFEDNIDLTPEEALFLVNSDIFQYCCAPRVVQFVFQWLANRETDSHISVANQILDTVVIDDITPEDSGCLSEHQKSQCVDMFEKYRNLQDNEFTGIKQLKRKLQIIIGKVYPDPKHSYNLRLKSKQASKKNAQETAVIAFTLRKNILGNLEVKPSSLTNPAYTLCCYRPRTKTWYHLFDVAAADVAANLTLWLDEEPATTMYKHELVYMNMDSYTVFCNLQSKTWRTVRLPEYVYPGKQGEDTSVYLSHYNFAAGSNELYLVFKETVHYHFGEFYEEEDFCRGLKLEEDGQSWKSLYVTKVEDEDSGQCDFDMQAAVSAVSNELMFVYGTDSSSDGHHYVCIVNLNHASPAPVMIDKFYIDAEEMAQTGIRIIQTKTHFYILYGSWNAKPVSDVQVAYEYEFNSMKLTKLQTALQTRIDKFDRVTGTYHRYLEDMCKARQRSIWMFEGDAQTVSFLREVELDENSNLAYKRHTPPPFSNALAVAVGQLSTDLLDSMTPVHRLALKL